MQRNSVAGVPPVEIRGLLVMDNKKQLVDAITKSAGSRRGPDGRKKLACAEAFELAGRFGVEVIEVGRLCNQNDVRICKCQLGCF
jgi:hypothetical protein